ncbi:MAG: hypothetical protein JW795_11070 [Chitinivibrionales bacterium]|nr:hypothetical protein [Chitinivibrionales bacterium]
MTVHTPMRISAVLFCILTFLGVPQGSESILILRSAGIIFEETAKSLSNEIAENFSVRDVVINETFSIESLQQEISQVSPRLIVLMNNAAIKLYKRYCETLSSSQQPTASLSIMGVYIEKSIEGLKNAAGISYEIPVVTSAANLRSILNMPVTKIGVIYREFMADFFQKNRRYCEAENMWLVERMIAKDENDYPAALEKNLKELLQQEKVEVIWIVNDNVFLKPDLIAQVWKPLLNKYKKPAIVGVESLVQPDIGLGTFAVLPDNIALGIQAAEMIYMASENGWKLTATVVPPLSVTKIVNMKLLTDYFKGKSFKLLNIDKVLQ